MGQNVLWRFGGKVFILRVEKEKRLQNVNYKFYDLMATNQSFRNKFAFGKRIEIKCYFL
jgi:hypothetical protein